MADEDRGSVLERFLGVKRLPVGPLVVIAVVAGGSAAAFAYTAGWLTPGRISPAKVVDVLGKRGGDPTGHRRNHAKGVCFTGYFEANGAGAALSTAPMLTPGRYPVVGRFAIAVADPLSPDAMGRVRSMAVRIVAPDGQEWRSGMNNMPVFVVSTPKDFYAISKTQEVDPQTGKPDPAAGPKFAASHPEMKPFLAWAKSAPFFESYAEDSYNSLNAFRFVDQQGTSRAVRWAMVSTAPAVAIPPDEMKARGPNFLTDDLKARLAKGELHWNLVATLAAPGDPTNDATKAWPADRPAATLGTLVAQKAEDEADGPCRDLNYDPTVLPKGIALSDDPLLPARSAAYANSFDRRTAEASAYPHKSQGAAQ